MTPREALYHLSMALGPVPITTRDDNISPQESVVRDAMTTLLAWVDAEVLPSGDLFMHIAEPRVSDSAATGVKIWDWGTGEITHGRPFNSIEPTDGTAVSHAETTDWDEQEDLSYTDGLIEDIIEWHYDRNLIDGSTDKDQFCKLIQECGELSDNLCKGKDISDDIGDIMVVLINIAERNDISISECLNIAYADIKDRKGTMVDGVFVKE